MIVLALASCGDDGGSQLGGPPAEPVEFTSTTMVYLSDAAVYGLDGIRTGQTVAMDRYVPEGDGPWPIVVIVHGTHSDVALLAPAVAERGAVVYAPDYLYESFPTSTEQIRSGLWMGGTTVGDLVCAVRTARADAVDHGGDPDHLVLVGFSRGGVLGATVALAGDDPAAAPGMSGSCAVSDGSVVPQAFVGLDAPYDLYTWAEEDVPEMVAFDSEAFQAMSPLSYTDRPPSDQPTVFHLLAPYQAGDYDDTVRLEAALATTGYPVTATFFPGAGHMAFIYPRVMPEVVDLIVDLGYGMPG